MTTAETYLQPEDRPAIRARETDDIPHTHVHDWLRRTMESAQDVVVVLLMVLLLAFALETLWRLFRAILSQQAIPSELLSDIVFVLILTELYRLLVYYLREHRVSVSLMLEVAIVGVLRDQIMITTHHGEWQRVLGTSVLLLVLGALLAVERWGARIRNDTSEFSAH